MTAAMTLLSAGEAQRLTQNIKSAATVVRDGLFKLRNLVDEAKSSNVWAVLGFPSWTAYLADTLGAEPMRLGREQRQELVEFLSGEGLTSRAIAPIVAVDQKTVVNDLRRTEESSSVGAAPATSTLTGLNNKTYQRPEAPTATADRRPSILDDARNAGWQLRKAIERVQRIAEDDRFTRNKAEILAALQPHLDLASETISGLSITDPSTKEETK